MNTQILQTKKLEAIYTVLKDSIDSDYQYTEDELAFINNRQNKYKNGEEETLTAEQFVSYVIIIFLPTRKPIVGSFNADQLRP